MACKEKELKKIGGYNAALCFYNSMWNEKVVWNDGTSKEYIIRNIVYHFSQHNMNAKPYPRAKTYLKQFETAIGNDYNTFGERLAEYIRFWNRFWKFEFSETDNTLTKLTKICSAVDNEQVNIYLVEVKKRTQLTLEIKGKQRKNMVAFLNHVKDNYNPAAGTSAKGGANKLKF